MSLRLTFSLEADSFGSLRWPLAANIVSVVKM